MDKVEKNKELKAYLRDKGIEDIFDQEVRRLRPPQSEKVYESMLEAFVFSQTIQGMEFWKQHEEQFQIEYPREAL